MLTLGRAVFEAHCFAALASVLCVVFVEMAAQTRSSHFLLILSSVTCGLWRMESCVYHCMSRQWKGLLIISHGLLLFQLFICLLFFCHEWYAALDLASAGTAVVFSTYINQSNYQSPPDCFCLWLVIFCFPARFQMVSSMFQIFWVFSGTSLDMCSLMVCC